ncbi:fluoride efflux transporter FluC [Paenisporosarcina antarctica]|uniref:Fluoride-specific ion channel FluC n=1 Tax=Paenisporosarcina antarctica TaxID=417367 RepID=A0A4P6ZUS7_9BACL|nr:CrcB family protein [Paenisporosarcina antarctica]QBP39997.1 CrcB family protein [Paenisporosarcina antarctica]
MKNILLVGTGGMMGALLRYSVMVTTTNVFVLWIENGVGSFILGWLTGRAAASGKSASLLWTTGVLGSFTTFATFSAEWLQLMQENIILAFVYGVGMTIFCFVAAALGFKVGGYLK